MDWLISRIKPKFEKKWFGTITIKFENGKITIIEETEKIKPPKNK